MVSKREQIFWYHSKAVIARFRLTQSECKVSWENLVGFYCLMNIDEKIQYNYDKSKDF